MFARSLLGCLSCALGLAMITPSAHGAQCSAFETIEVFGGLCPTLTLGGFQWGAPQTSQTYSGFRSGGSLPAPTYSARSTSSYSGLQPSGSLTAPTYSARSTPASGGLQASVSRVVQAAAYPLTRTSTYGWGWGFGGWGWGYGRISPAFFRSFGHAVVSRH